MQTPVFCALLWLLPEIGLTDFRTKRLFFAAAICVKERALLRGIQTLTMRSTAISPETTSNRMSPFREVTSP